MLIKPSRRHLGLAPVFALAFACALFALPADAGARLRIACVGEQTTHSLHRVNDPEFPLLLGQALDADFTADATPNPIEGGFYSGQGAHYSVGNFGNPNGSVIDHDLDNPKSLLRSDEVKAAESFAPDIVILGPFGEHELLTKVGMDHYGPDLRRLVARLRAFPGHPVVYLLQPIPPSGADDDDTYRQIRSDTLAVAREQGLPAVDLWTPFLGHPELFKDPTHLTEDGRRKLALTVAAAVAHRP